MRWFVICWVMETFVLACGQPQQQSPEAERLRSQIYFTREDPGRWKDFKEDHEPEVKKTSPGQIEVRVEMVVDIGHYIEAIVVSDASQREIASKSFKRGERAQATLAIPPEKMNGAAVIAKCNLHGMWRKALP